MLRLRAALASVRLAGRELTGDDLIEVAARLVPLSRTMREQIDHISRWAFERAVRASPRRIV